MQAQNRVRMKTKKQPQKGNQRRISVLLQVAKTNIEKNGALVTITKKIENKGRIVLNQQSICEGMTHHQSICYQLNLLLQMKWVQTDHAYFVNKLVRSDS